ncbi:hypothetical protein LCGC14_0355830 [marine sediment metagenome]|uniref:Uncharacterized protein n=1 Tax=marine sediment metagenome TaxID=412755 RepID=A0A0F9VWL7_9ZZZZ
MFDHMDTIAEQRGIAENQYRQSFSHTIDFGKRKKSKFMLLAGNVKPEHAICKNAPAPKRRRSTRQKCFIPGCQNMSLRGMEVAARMDLLRKK